MADPIPDNSNQNGGNPPTPPATPPAAPPATPPAGGDGGDLDINNPAAVNQKLGELTGKIKDFDDYKKKVEPILAAIYRDPKVYEAVNDSYQILMGVKNPLVDKDGGAEPPKPDGATPPATPPKPAEPSAGEKDNRNAIISQTVSKFETGHGMDKMKPEDKAALNVKILTELKEILDPGDTGKSGVELLDGVPAASVPRLLEKAYTLATHEESVTAAKDAGAKEQQGVELGLIGAVPGGSIEESSVKLSEKEKQIARKQGITEEKYLANKKEVLRRKGSIA